MRNRVIPLLFLVFASSCATSTGGAGDGLYLIGQETLESGAGDREALYDTVQRLRPHWLRLNASVFIDGTRRGNPLVLREVMTTSVEQVRFHPPEKSVALYGGQFMNGVIEVTRRQ